MKRRAPRLFAIAWAVVVVVVWNAIFDRSILLASRAYVEAARQASRMTGQMLLIQDWMPREVERALYNATAVAGALMLVGLGLFTWLDRKTAPPTTTSTAP